MRNVSSATRMVARAHRPEHGLPDRRPRLHGAGAAARRAGRSASSTPASPSRTWSPSPPAWRAPGLATSGSTASRRSVYARPFEQIRNDVCLHRLPVMLVGNGGGYGYGVMGPRTTRWRITARSCCRAARLRAGLRRRRPGTGRRCSCSTQEPVPSARPVRAPPGRRRHRLRPLAPLAGAGDGWTVLVVGPLVGRDLERRPVPRGREQGPPSGSLCELPVTCPQAFIDDLERSQRLLVIEEHVAHGGVGRNAGRLASCARAAGRTGSRPEPRKAISPAATARSGSIARKATSTPDAIAHFLTSQPFRGCPA